MVYFTANALKKDPKLAAHMQQVEKQRMMFNANEKALEQRYGLAANAALDRDFWVQVDGAMPYGRNRANGIEILDDLSSVVTNLSVGKTLYGYRIAGDIAQDVSVSIDGSKPYSFDKVSGAADGDPIPVFTSGFGANWRDVEGNRSVSYDLIADSQEAKMKVHYEKLVNYLLVGDANIVIDGKEGQGLKNHRNTKKINLGSSGANIDLSSAATAPADIVAFFTTGAFGTTAQANRVAGYDVVWVSYAIWNNLRKVYATNGLQVNALDQIVGFGMVREFRPTYALTGNEFLGYVRDRSSLVLPVGAATAITAQPRVMPQDNFNFQIMTVMGVQVRKQYDNRGGVVYGGSL